MTLRWVPGWNGLTEPEAVEYVAAVEAADGEPLEFGVAKAINDFVLGCKNDGIWDAIKASCILAGARTLNGALVPLVGTAPTNFNFVAGDYNRETGLVGNGSTKYLDSNTAINSAWQNNAHVSIYVSTGSDNAYMGALNPGATSGVQFINSGGSGFIRLNSSSSLSISDFSTATGLVAAVRSNATELTRRISGVSTTASNASATPPTESIHVFQRNYSSGFNPTSARLAFYSIGESLDLALLDARVTALITAIGAAIP
jgi:hypothetical protein